MNSQPIAVLHDAECRTAGDILNALNAGDNSYACRYISHHSNPNGSVTVMGMDAFNFPVLCSVYPSEKVANQMSGVFLGFVK